MAWCTLGRDDNNVYALNATTGTLLWNFATGNFVGSPSVANGVVYVGSGDGKVYAFDQTGGALARTPPELQRLNPATLQPDYSLRVSRPR